MTFAEVLKELDQILLFGGLLGSIEHGLTKQIPSSSVCA